jgi:hypothetical protein
MQDGIYLKKNTVSRSQWLRGRRHEMSSHAQTLGWWIRIPLEAWMSVRVPSMFVFCIGSGLATGLITRQRSPPDCPQFLITCDGRQARWSNTKCRRRI